MCVYYSPVSVYVPLWHPGSSRCGRAGGEGRGERGEGVERERGEGVERERREGVERERGERGIGGKVHTYIHTKQGHTLCILNLIAVSHRVLIAGRIICVCITHS